MIKYIFILSLLAPGLLASIINFDENTHAVDMDEEDIKKDDTVSCDGDEIINLSGVGFSEIPTKLVKSNVIRFINLNNNEISHVPESILNAVPQLQCLNLARNRIPFDQLLSFSHDNLKTLILDYQGKHGNVNHELLDENVVEDLSLTASKTYLPSLENLHLSGIDFEIFPSNMNEILPNLVSLYLTNNGFRYLSPNIMSRLPRTIKHLHLERNSFDRLDLDRFENLESLYLDGNPLYSIGISSSNNLKVLSLSRCPGHNNANLQLLRNLVTLDISFNGIEEVPGDRFDSNPYLENLSLNHNRLSRFPLFSGLENLTSLSLSYNEILNITEMILPQSLKRLNLRGNGIMYVDRHAFAMLAGLEKLDLSMNRLTSLPIDWSQNLKSLRYLNLRMNRFLTVGDMNVVPALNLVELYVKDNPVKSVDVNALRYLPAMCTLYVL